MCDQQDPKLQHPEPTERWIKFAAVAVKEVEQRPAVAAPEQKRIMPKVITFDEKTGTPTNAQATRVLSESKSAVSVILPFAEWRRSTVAQDLAREAGEMAAILAGAAFFPLYGRRSCGQCSD